MKRFAFFIAAFALVIAVGLSTGCSVVQARINHDVQAVTVPDLQAALADAQAANDQDGAACWGEVLKYVQSLPTESAAVVPHVAGVASAIEAARIAANTPAPSLPPIPHALHTACAVLQVDAQQLAIKFGLNAMALKTGFGIAKAGVQLKTEAAALKAEAAALGAHP